MSKFQEAGPAETLRSSQKDDQYMGHMKTLLSEVIQGSLGVSHWLKWRHVYDSFSDVIYFVLTTVSGFQTLGEEYVHIIQVDSTLRKLPSVKQRLISIFFHVFGPVLTVSLKKYLDNRLQMQSPDGKINHQLHLLRLLELSLWLSFIIHKLNLIVFYFCGRHYHLSKRLTGIRYVLIRRWLAQLNSLLPYKVLGAIASVQLFTSLLLDIKKFYNSLSLQVQTVNSSAEEIPSDETVVRSCCSLCTEKLKNATVTPCGHLFCWSCITTWLQNKEECPLCREKFGPSRLVYLQNYI